MLFSGIIYFMKIFRERLIEYGTYFIVFLLPILYFGSSRYLAFTTSKTFFFYGCVEIIFAFWVYTLFVDEKYRLSKKMLLLFTPFSVYIIWLTISGVLSLNWEMSFWSSLGRGTGLITLYHTIALACVVSSLVKLNNFSYIKKLIISFIAGSFILIISIWLGSEGFNLSYGFLQKSKGGGLIGNSSLSATYLIFSLFFAFFLFGLKEISKKLRLFLWIFIALVFLSPLFLSLYSLFSETSFSVSARGAIIGILAGAVVSVLGYLSLSSNKKIKILGISGIAISALVFSVLWINLLKPDTSIHKKVADSISESRFIFWDIATKAIRERPILGWGPENYPIVYQKYFNSNLYLQSDTTVETWNDRAHNIIFDTGVSGGLVAIALYFVVLISLIYAIFRGYNLDKISRLQASVLFGLITAYFLQNLFVFDSFVSLMAFSIFCGIVFGINSDDEKEKNKIIKNSSKKIIATFLVFIFVPIWFYCAWMPARKVEVFSKVIKTPLNLRSEHYVDLLDGSAVGNSFEVGSLADDAYKLYSKNQSQILKDPELLKYSQIDLNKFLVFLDEISKKETNDYRLYLSMVRLYNLQVLFSGKPIDPELQAHIFDVAKHAQVLSPNDPQIDWSMAQTFLFTGDRVGAQKALEHAILIAPNIPWTHRFLIKFAKDTNNQELYKNAVNNAINAIPGFLEEEAV